MATTFLPRLTQERRLRESRTHLKEVRADPVRDCKPLKSVSHTGLWVQKPPSPDPKAFYVYVIIDPKREIELYVEYTDTVNDLLEDLRLNPEHVDVVYKGKRVELYQTLFDLGVKPRDEFFIESETQECGAWERLKNVSHTSLRVQRPPSPDPESFHVKVIIAPKQEITLYVKNTDTFKKILLDLKLDPRHAYAVYKGKTVELLKTLSNLGVRKMDKIIICKICHGG